jgi:hypothetical protein
MTVEALKSIPIVNSDALPIILNDVGSGAPGYLRAVNGHIAASTGASVGSTYRLVRLPRDAKIKRLFVTNGASGATGNVDIGVAFSDSTTDGTNINFQQLGMITISGGAPNRLFGAGTAITSKQNNLDATFGNSYTTDLMNLPLWQVLVNQGTTVFTSDPFGFFDIMLAATTVIATGCDLAIEVWYVSAT